MTENGWPNDRQEGNVGHRKLWLGQAEPTDRKLHVVCRLSRPKDQALLVEWLESLEDTTVATPQPTAIGEEPFDLCIFDRQTLTAAATAFHHYAAERANGYVPCLLVIPEQASIGDVLGGLPADVRSLVTEVIRTPIGKSELAQRLVSLFRIRRLSADLYESRERYRRVLELTPEAVTIVTDDKVAYVNDAACELLADTEERLLGRSAQSVFGSAWDEILEQVGKNELIEPTPFFRGEISPVDESIPVEFAAVRFGPEGESIALVVRDVTDQREREERLRLYRRAMDEAKIGVSITDATAEDNPLVYVNRELERLTGRSAEELLGRNPRIFQTDRTDPETLASIREAVDAGESISVELLNERADGTEWYNALDIAPIYEDGELRNFIGFQRDVTRKREREQQFAVLDRVLRHNLRNRLNVILGHAEDLTEYDGGDAAAVRSHAETAVEAATELLELSEDARRFRMAIRSEAAGSSAVDLVGIVREAVAEAQPAAKRAGVEITTSLSATASVPGGGSVRFAIDELLTNAIIHNDADEPAVSVTLSRDGDTARLVVADNGPGIPETERAALTGELETSTDHASGLGLWLVRWSVEAAGGSVSYAEAEPRGSRVAIELPLADS